MNTATCHSREGGNPAVAGNHWIPASAGMTSHSRRKLLFVELIAKIALAFAIGLATSIALAGLVLLLAHDARAAKLVPMKPKEIRQGTLLLKSGGTAKEQPAAPRRA